MGMIEDSQLTKTTPITSKTILIGMNNKFSSRANKGLFVFLGLLFFLQGLMGFFREEIAWWRWLFGIIMVVGGISYVIYGFLAFSQNSKQAPRIIVDHEFIGLKHSIWKRAIQLSWSEVTSIEFKKFEVVFQGGEASKSFSYASNADVSIEIKQALREVAEEKGIEVIGG